MPTHDDVSLQKATSRHTAADMEARADAMRAEGRDLKSAPPAPIPIPPAKMVDGKPTPVPLPR